MGQVADLVSEYAQLIQPYPGPPHSLPDYLERFQLAFRMFLDELRTLENVENQIADGLRGLLKSRDWRMVLLWHSAADSHGGFGLVSPLCELLDLRDKYVQHEMIAVTLGKIGSPQAIRSLNDLCLSEFPYNGGCSLQKRCLDALTEIGSAEAMACVQSHIASPWPEVREYAKELLCDEEPE